MQILEAFYLVYNMANLIFGLEQHGWLLSRALVSTTFLLYEFAHCLTLRVILSFQPYLFAKKVWNWLYNSACIAQYYTLGVRKLDSVNGDGLSSGVNSCLPAFAQAASSLARDASLCSDSLGINDTTCKFSI